MRSLNVKLLVILVVSAAVFLLGAYVVHAFQVHRTAGALLIQAEKKIEDGDLLEAEKLYRRYLKHEPEDSEIEKKRALVFTDYALTQDATGRDRQSAVVLLEQALRSRPDDRELRRRTADFSFQLGRFSDAIVHYEQLIESDSSDAEAYLRWAQALAQDSQPKEARAKLEECIEKHPQYVPAYTTLSEVLHGAGVDDPDAAAEVIELMVERNPEDPQAYVARSNYRMRVSGSNAEAEAMAVADADVARALELDPESESVLNFAARYEARRHALLKDDNPEEAAQHLQRASDYAMRASTAHPDSTEAKSFLAQVATYTGDRDTAEDVLDKALEDAPLDPSLLLQRADIYMGDNDIANLRRTISDMREAHVRQDRVDLYEARALMLEGEWRKASELLTRIRPRLILTEASPEQIDLLLGSCYLRLGQQDRALAAFRSARELVDGGDPKRRMAVEQTLAASLIQAGKTDEGIKIYRELAKASPQAKEALVAALMLQEGTKPKGRRDWTEVERLLESLEEAGADSLSVQMSRVDLLSQQGKTEEAFKVLDAARVAHPDAVNVWVALAFFQARHASAEKGLEVLDQAREVLTARDHGTLLNTEIRIVLSMPAEQTLERLPQLEERVATLEEAYQPAAYELLAQVYGIKEDTASMLRLFRRQAELQKGNVEVRTRLLSIARTSGDTELASQMVEQLKEILGTNSPTVRQVEAEDIVIAVAKDELPKTELERARRLVDAIEGERPDWVVVPRLRGEIERLSDNPDRAIANYQRAIELGENNTAIGRRLLGLLTQQNRLDEVDEVLEWLKARGAAEGTGKLEAVLLLNKDATNIEEALPLYEAAVKDSKNYGDFLSLGKLRQQAGKTVEAEVAFRQAVQLDDQVPNTWLELVQFLATTGRAVEAEEVIRQASGKLPAEKAAATTARCYELIGNGEKAEALFLQAIEDASDKTIAREELVKFYRRTEQTEELAAVIEQILKAGADANNERGMASLRWARLIKAGIIAGGNDFRRTSEAIDLIEQNRVDGELDIDNKAIKARILAARSDQKSRSEAMALFEEVHQLRQPTADERLILARLYELAGQWSRCRDVMFAAMSEAPNNAQLIATYIEMSMRHREFADVSRFIERLAKLAPNEEYVKAARGRMLIHQGDVLKGVALIKSLAPTTVTDENVNKLRSIADLLTKLQQHEEAEKMYRAFTAQRPADSRYFARFLATYPDADVHEALRLAEQDLGVSLPRRAEAIANGLTALRNHRVVLEPADYDLVESWIEKALADDPNSVSHTLQLAELNDIKGSYDKAEALYRKVFATEGLTDTQMAIAENNLSYLLALTDRTGDEALPMIEDAINRLGPISQLLDTRGMVYLAMEKVGPALSDFEGAVVEEASGMAYYHLALAQQANNDRRAAARSFDSAKSNGFRDTNLSRLERPQFDQLMQVLGEG